MWLVTFHMCCPNSLLLEASLFHVTAPGQGTWKLVLGFLRLCSRDLFPGLILLCTLFPEYSSGVYSSMLSPVSPPSKP